MAKDIKPLRQRFYNFIKDKWDSPNSFGANFRQARPTSGVYIIVMINFSFEKMEYEDYDIVYIGSSTNLCERRRVHEVIDKIYKEKLGYPFFYFKEMKRGFFDYEIKLIKKMRPMFNKLKYDNHG